MRRKPRKKPSERMDEILKEIHSNFPEKYDSIYFDVIKRYLDEMAQNYEKDKKHA